jgi:hypothetical protein
VGTQNDTEWTPTDKQLLVLDTAREIGLQRSISAVAIESGVSRITIHKWLREDADFKEAWQDIPNKLLSNHLPGIYAALIRKAVDGDVQAIKLALEVTGKYTPAVQRHEVKHEGQIDLTCLSEDDLRGLEAIAAKLRERSGPALATDRAGEAPQVHSN